MPEKNWVEWLPQGFLLYVELSCPPEMTYNQAFEFAIRDLRTNHEEYYRFFLEN